MNYQKIHDDLVEHCRNQVLPKNVYTEKHHVIPRSFGGKDGSNIIVVTARQHFVLHALLYFIAKRTGTAEERQKMAHAWNFMRSPPTGNLARYINGRLFEASRQDMRERMSIAQSGEKNSQANTMWITNGLTSKKLKPGEAMPEGWWGGRYSNGSVYDPEVPYRHERFNCVKCGTEFFRKTSKSKAQRKNKCDPCVKLQTTPFLILKRDEFLELLDTGMSPNKACVQIGKRYNTGMARYGMSGAVVRQVRQILEEENKLHLIGG